MRKWLCVLTTVLALPPMRWDISSCLETEIRAEDATKIVVSQSFPNPIQRGWSCEYIIFSPNTDERIVIEFQHFSLDVCALQNFTIIDDESGKSAGPYCNIMSPPQFVSDSSKIRIMSITGQTPEDQATEGYMFTFQRVGASFVSAIPEPTSPQNGAGSPSGFPGLGNNNFGNYGNFGGGNFGNNFGGGYGNNFGPGLGLPPSGFGNPGRNPGLFHNSVPANGIPVYGPHGQQTTVYNTDGKGNVVPEIEPPKAPDVLSNLPGGKTEYIQPNYDKNQRERLLIDLNEGDDSWKWTMPKAIGIAAASLCFLAIMSVAVQHYLREREKEIARKLAAKANEDESDTDTSFTSFDSEEEKEKKQRTKKRQKRKDRDIAMSQKKATRGKRDVKKVAQTDFDEKTLKNAERAINVQKLQKKLMKYT